MPLTQLDFLVLKTIAIYYLVTREQVQTLLFAHHKHGRSTRKHLTRLRHAGYITKHQVPVALPGTNGAAPVYYMTKAGAEALASFYDDDSFLATNTRTPRADRLAHWIAINTTRITIEQAIELQQDVTLEGWITEWETINKDAHPSEQFVLHSQLRDNPPLSCSPDAAFLLGVKVGEIVHKKVFYLEQDRATSSPKQIAARKSNGYAELAVRAGHKKHFAETTVDAFSVLMVTTNAYRCRATAAELRDDKPRPELWLFINQQELSPTSFLFDPITYDHQGNAGPLIRLPDTKQADIAGVSASDDQQVTKQPHGGALT